MNGSSFPDAFWGVFDGERYLRSNPDVAAAGVPPERHFMENGAFEGRLPWSPEKAGSWLQRRRPAPPENAVELSDPLPAAAVLNLECFAGSRAGAKTLRLRALWCDALLARGHRVLTLDERGFHPTPGACPLVVAPHEFFYGPDGRPWPGSLEVRDYVALNTGGVATSAFAMALPFLSRARVVLDCDPQNAAVLRDLGLPAYHLPPPLPMGGPGPLPPWPRTVYVSESVKSRGADTYAGRPYDIIAYGRRTDRRSRALARLAPALTAYDAFLSFPTPRALSVSPDKAAIDPALLHFLCGRARIYLHLHEGEIPSFPWQKAAGDAMTQGTLVLTEPGFPMEGLVEGQHYLAAELGDWPRMLAAMLRTPEGMRDADRIRLAGAAALKERGDPADFMGAIVKLWEDGRGA